MSAAIPHGTHAGYNQHKCRCTECRAFRSRWSRDYYRRNREEISAKAREARRADPERYRDHSLRYVNSEKGRAQRRRYYEENKDTLLEKNRRNKFLSRYGISPEDIEAVREAQENRCAICRTETELCVDHCHESGEFRGLLCDKCNRGLGYFADDPDALRRAAAYLGR